MNGNQTAVLAISYMLEARKAKGIAQPNDMVIKTIVTGDMIVAIAEKNNVACYNVLTGRRPAALSEKIISYLQLNLAIGKRLITFAKLIRIKMNQQAQK
jgi:phosphomannomutase